MAADENTDSASTLTLTALVPGNELRSYLSKTVENWNATTDYVESDSIDDNPVATLLAHNYNLWHLERRVRENRDDHSKVTKFKATIDSENKARNQAIQRIDEEIEDRTTDSVFATADLDEYELNSETVGQMIDRITILTLKYYYTERELEEESLDDDRTAECRRRLATFEEQLEYVTVCLKDFLNALETGNAKMLPYKEMKFYKEDDLDPRAA